MAFAGLAGFHAWLHDQHLCYAVRRQARPHTSPMVQSPCAQGCMGNLLGLIL